MKAARKLLKDDDDTLGNAAYNLHQCAEKALKGYLVFKQTRINKTHDLELLVKLCIEIEQDFIALKEEVKQLNPYATDSRYPDDYFKIDRTEVEEAILKTTKILNFVKKKIEKTSNPTLKIFS